MQLLLKKDNLELTEILDVDTEVMKKYKKIIEIYEDKIKLNADGNYHVYVDGKHKKAKTKESLYESIYKELYSSPTFAEAYNLMQQHERDIKHELSTIERRDNDYNKFVLGAKIEKIRMNKMKAQDLRDFVDYLIIKFNGKMTHNALTNVFSLINKTFMYCINRDMISWDSKPILTLYRKENLKSDSDFYKPIKCEDETLDVNTDNLLHNIVLESKNPRDLAIRMQRALGCRTGEVVALKASDFDLQKRICNIQRTEAKNKANGVIIKAPKTATRRKKPAYLTDEAIETYHAMLAIHSGKSEYLFEENGKRITRSMLYHRIKRLCHNHNLNTFNSRGLRKTFTSEMYDNGVNPKFIANQLGHSKITTSMQHYNQQRLSTKDAQIAINNAVGKSWDKKNTANH